MTELLAKRALVIGLGITGRSVARFLHARGVKLVLTDQRVDVDTAGLPTNAELVLGQAPLERVENVDLVITSPGVPRSNILIRRAVELGIPVVSEIELANWFIDTPLIAVTGTNGKSTVTTMVGEILKASGARVFTGGNLGVPLIEAIGSSYDFIVAEVSSFQLEWIRTFRPWIAVYLNLSEDHLDRYRDLDEYGRFKARIFENQHNDNWAVLNRDDARVWSNAPSLRARVSSFGMERCDHANAIWYDAGALHFAFKGREGTIGIERLRLPGLHNIANAMAASMVALICEVAPQVIEEALARYRGLPHRLEFVRELRGITFIDDSKSTNVDGARVALQTVKAPIVWIAGGLDKGGDYGPLRPIAKEKVKVAILMGQARERIRQQLGDAAPTVLVPTLADAVEQAASQAGSGDTVLLSPACSSFDQFKDYAERGRVFKKLVMAL